MYIANIYSWDRFDNELQMLVIIFDDWRLGVMVPSPPKALKILTPESTRKHGELTLAYKPKQFFLLFQQKKKKERERPDCPCESFGSPAAMSGEGDRWLQHREKCYFSQVHDAKQHLHYSGELLWYRGWTVSSHNNPQTCPTTGQGFSLWFAELRRGEEEEEKKKKREGAHEAWAKWNLA